MTASREPIGVIGTGYVGLVTAAGFAELGNEVHCIDIDAGKIERLKNGEIPIYEPGLAEMVERNRERLHFSTNLADALEHARLLFVAVGTPPTYSGDADLSAVNAVVGSMPASDSHALVMKSTVPVGLLAVRSLVAPFWTARVHARRSCPQAQRSELVASVLPSVLGAQGRSPGSDDEVHERKLCCRGGPRGALVDPR